MLIQTYRGLRPTTRAIAGTVNGKRQMNSTMRLIRGSRSRTQTIVGSSKASIPSDVITASCREVTIPFTSPGVCAIRSQASSVRGEVTSVPRVENSSIAPTGMRKNAPMRSSTTTRKTRSLSRRDLVKLVEPTRRASLEQGVQSHHDDDDEYHRHRQRLGQAGLRLLCLAREQGLDLQGHVVTAVRQQGRDGRVGGERVREQEERAAQERRCQQWAGDVAPVMPGAAAEALGRLSPLRPDAVERRQEHEHHQRDLEVQVDQRYAGWIVEPHAVGIDVDAVALEKDVDETDGAD